MISTDLVPHITFKSYFLLLVSRSWDLFRTFTIHNRAMGGFLDALRCDLNFIKETGARDIPSKTSWAGRGNLEI